MNCFLNLYHTINLALCEEKLHCSLSFRYCYQMQFWLKALKTKILKQLYKIAKDNFPLYRKYTNINLARDSTLEN